MSPRARRFAAVAVGGLVALALAHGVGEGVAGAQAPGAASASASSSGAAPAAEASAPTASPASSPPAQATAAPDVDGGGSVYATCVEHLPDGAKRPRVSERFPARGYAGHALALEIDVEHGAGESVLPHGFSVQASGVEADALGRAGFMLPSPDGGAPPRLEPIASAGGKGPVTRTKVVIQVVALPKEAGRHEMVLPPLPLAVARASGEMMTLCTAAHPVTVEDPTSNTPDAKPRPNPPARRQLETWGAARDAFYAAIVALVAALVGALLYRWHKRRPRPVPPPPPPRPAWELALESLYHLRDGHLLREGRQGEFVDQVSDIVRRYLGAMFGFDGLEATSREVRRAVRAVAPPPPVLAEIDRVLDESDLVKFARVAPGEGDCEALLELALIIVQRTMPTGPTGPTSGVVSVPAANEPPSPAAGQPTSATPSDAGAPTATSGPIDAGEPEAARPASSGDDRGAS